MYLKIFGPNLSDQSKGTFHVHKADCEHNKFYGPGRKYGGQFPMAEPTVDLDNAYAVVEYCYSDQIDERMHDETTREDEIEDLLSDFWFAPCTDELPHDASDREGDTYECWVADQKGTWHKLKSDDKLGVVSWLMTSLQQHNQVGTHIHIVVHHSSEYSEARVLEPEMMNRSEKHEQ
jgi:hypothetical protein